MPKYWNFRKILNVHPETDNQCVAIKVKSEERCRIRGFAGKSNLREAGSILDTMDSTKNVSECRTYLHDLAFCTMCGNPHRNMQTVLDDRVRRWNKTISLYVASKETEARRDETVLAKSLLETVTDGDNSTPVTTTSQLQKVDPGLFTVTWNNTSMPQWEGVKSVDRSVAPFLRSPSEEDPEVVTGTSMPKLQDTKPVNRSVAPIPNLPSEEGPKVAPETFNVTWNQTSMPKWEEAKPVDTSVAPMFNLKFNEGTPIAPFGAVSDASVKKETLSNSRSETPKVLPETFSFTWNQTSMPKWEDAKPVDISVAPTFNLHIEERPDISQVGTTDKPDEVPVIDKIPSISSANLWEDESTFVEEADVEMPQHEETNLPNSTAEIQIPERPDEEAHIEMQQHGGTKLPNSTTETQVLERPEEDFKLDEPENEPISNLPSARSSRLSLKTNIEVLETATFPTHTEEVSPVSPLDQVFPMSSTVSSPSVCSTTVSPIEMFESDISFESISSTTTAAEINPTKNSQVAIKVDEGLENEIDGVDELDGLDAKQIESAKESTENRLIPTITSDEITSISTEEVHSSDIDIPETDIQISSSEINKPIPAYEKRQTRSTTQYAISQNSKSDLTPELTTTSTSPTEPFGHVLVDSTSRRYPQRFSDHHHYHSPATPKSKSKPTLSPIVTVTEEQAYKYRISFDSQISQSSAAAVPKAKLQRKERRSEIIGHGHMAGSKERVVDGLEQIPWENDRGIIVRKPKGLRGSLKEAWSGVVTRSKRKSLKGGGG